MDYWQAFVLGLVEGLTEFLPVSSTGHLFLTGRLLGFRDDDEWIKAFEIVIQFGAILAVLGVYSLAVVDMFRGLQGRSPAGLRLLIRLLIAFALTAGPAWLWHKPIKAHLFSLPLVAGAWIVGGLFILALERWRRRRQHSGLSLDQLTLPGACIIGLMQTLALCPGVSRSLAALAGGVFAGLSLAAALEFSFLLGGITLTAASAYEALKHREDLVKYVPPGPGILAVLTATVVAWLTVRWMLGTVNRLGLTPFAWYRIGLGLLVLALIAAGRLA